MAQMQEEAQPIPCYKTILRHFNEAVPSVEIIIKGLQDDEVVTVIGGDTVPTKVNGRPFESHLVVGMLSVRNQKYFSQVYVLLIIFLSRFKMWSSFTRPYMQNLASIATVHLCNLAMMGSRNLAQARSH